MNKINKSMAQRDLKSSKSDSSERLALINTSEELGQARDTSTHVTFNALNSTSSPRILDSLFMLFDRREGGKKNLQMFG